MIVSHRPIDGLETGDGVILAATPAHIIKCAGKAGECLCKIGVFKIADILLLCVQKAIYTRYNMVFNVD